MNTRHYVFINPDGTGDPYVFVIVEAPTGIIYGEQCMGYATEERTLEGFLIPILASPEPLIRFFARFHSYPPTTDWVKWHEKDVAELSDVVNSYVVWFTAGGLTDPSDERTILQLDLARLSETTEAWVRVLTPYGPGVLVFPNSD